MVCKDSPARCTIWSVGHSSLTEASLFTGQKVSKFQSIYIVQSKVSVLGSSCWLGAITSFLGRVQDTSDFQVSNSCS